mgnify:CR=1 FL=1
MVLGAELHVMLAQVARGAGAAHTGAGALAVAAARRHDGGAPGALAGAQAPGVAGPRRGGARGEWRSWGGWVGAMAEHGCIDAWGTGGPGELAAAAAL